MIADQIPRVEIEQMPGSFEVIFADGSIRNQSDTSWKDISGQALVEYFGIKKTVFLCTFPVKQLTVSMDGMEAHIDVPEGAQAYQAIRSNMTVGKGTKEQLLGRCVGIVKDGVVIEEKFINGVQKEVFGMKL